MNIDCARDILLQLRGGGGEFTITDYAEKAVHQAAGELRRKGYIRASTSWIPGQPYEYVCPRALTEKGEELAAAIADDIVWRQVKQWLPRPEDRVSLEALRLVAEKVGRMRN